MMIRRVLAGLAIFLFIAFSLPAFLFFGISNSFLRASFYEGPIVDTSYDFLVSATAKNLLQKDEIIAAFFNETDLKSEIVTVFPVSLFKGIVADFANQLENAKENKTEVLSISLKVFRESLLTLANNLAFKLFQKLPVCVGGQIPAEDLRGLPTCVPEGAQYNEISAPFTRRFEATVYSVVPEQIQRDLSAPMGQNGVTPMMIIKWFAYSKYVIYGVLLALLAAIALLIFHPFSLIMQYEGIAFAFSGIAGYLLSMGLSLMPDYLLSGANFPLIQSDLQKLMQYVMSYVVAESQKIAMIFLALGAVLILIRVFLKQKYHGEQTE
jgi:hypothetical protein